jgi:transcriptional regulator with XRE-family HTH domain
MNGLEFLLKHNNMQNKELADKLGVSKQIISIWIKGIRPIAKTHLPKLCEILNTSESFLKQNIDGQILNFYWLQCLMYIKKLLMIV